MNNDTFYDLAKKLANDLQLLANDSKRRNPEIRRTSEKSFEILKTCKSHQDLQRHPDFIVPFLLSCSSKNVKLIFTSMQSFQRLAVETSIPNSRIPQVLDAFIECTNLSSEIQLKVLQILPVFFKTYSSFIVGENVKKVLACCTNLLQHNNSSIVISSASATLQQLINSIFERKDCSTNHASSNDGNTDENEKFNVLKDNVTTITVGRYGYDTNIVFTDLCSAETRPNSLLNIKFISAESLLEILESIFLNQRSCFCEREDLQFILRTKAVPLLLRQISAQQNKNFMITVRSYRAAKYLINVDFIQFLAVELEVIISFFNHILEKESGSPTWKKILTLELFSGFSFVLWNTIYENFDLVGKNRKPLFITILTTLQKNLHSKQYTNYLMPSSVLAPKETPIISAEASQVKVPFLELVDKQTAPVADQTYEVFLLFKIFTSISSDSEVVVLKLLQNKASLQDFTKMIIASFPYLFGSLRTFFHSSTLDVVLFRSLVRGFQKLTHTCVLLKIQSEVDKSLDLFSRLIVLNEFTGNSGATDVHNNSTILSTISETLIGSSNDISSNDNENTSEKLSNNNNNIEASYTRVSYYPRVFNSRNIDLFKALISLCVSSGANFSSSNWKLFFKIYQWCAYYIYGPSPMFQELYVSIPLPPSPDLPKPSLNSIENNFSKFLESTTKYAEISFKNMVGALISESSQALVDDRKIGGCKPFEDEEGLETTELQICTYNRDFYLNFLGNVSEVFATRFFRIFETNTWNIILDYFITELSKRRSNTLPEERLAVANVFTEIIKAIANSADENNNNFDGIEEHVMKALMKLIDSIMSLGLTNSVDVYNGNINVESDILLQALRTVKDLLDNYGDYLNHSWSSVFKIIDCPFSVINDTKSLEIQDKEEQNAITDILKSKHKSMISVSFSVFKLISDDFLQTLHLKHIKSIIDILVHFAKQTLELNISFTAISEFWIIGDYLRSLYEALPKTKYSLEKFSSSKNVEDLATIIISPESSDLELYHATLLYLLKRLLSCANDTRLEVIDGTMVTFFRVLAAQDSCLPSWDIVYEIILFPLLDSSENSEVPKFVNTTLNGLNLVYLSHFAEFSGERGNTDKWLKFISYYEIILKNSKNYDSKFNVLINLKTLLKKFSSHEEISFPPKEVVMKIFSLWIDYDIIYTDFNKSVDKSNYDCIQELISCYPSLCKLLEETKLLDFEVSEKIVRVFTQAIKYPLLPQFSLDKAKPSSLQSTILSALECFDTIEDSNIKILVLWELSSISTLPFNVKDTIVKKLAPKLPNNLKSRIPTFSAVSYKACALLNAKFHAVANVKDQDAKFLQIFKNLSDIILSKSQSDLSEEKNCKLWVLASKTFHSISVEIFNMDNGALRTDSSFITNFTDIFIKAVIGILERNNDSVQEDEAEEIEQYALYRNFLVENIDIFSKETLELFISRLWTRSFFYEVNEIEDQIINGCKSLNDVVIKLTSFDFDNLLGSCDEPHLLPKFNLTLYSLKDLLKFSENEHMRNLCLPFFLSRVAFVLRRFISDERLRIRKPIASIRKNELLWVLQGLIEVSSSFHGNDADKLKVLYPLLLEIIPVSERVKDLQRLLPQLSLIYYVK
ncbi:Mon2p SCDLUD_005041 [Saccharomycodes ludwigii]|uniref:Mon2p n=1 Tax=Saccharomycodes ludwigii TaxID=36035 RepID=UPI001E889535|nr:hypothetical protein SCDLUD_005041 [Saccharomycodes ludwigii]KAH3898717.1 hypothetical protein SCDLUD_005041 [Saccharomycodes ludwigii]